MQMKVNLGTVAKSQQLNGGATEHDLQVVFQIIRRAQGKIFDGQQSLEITKSLAKIAQDAGLDISKIEA
tara:strand:- start:4801 stop:5007 length:207 start_codon:yes stop_codon:yes gene_type:complete